MGGQSKIGEMLEYFNRKDLDATINISLKNKYVYCEVPKAGSSSIKKTLTHYELAGMPSSYMVGPHPRAVESPFVKPYQLTRMHLRQIMDSDKYFKFTFVRNPYSRTLSAFRDKLFTGNQESNAAYRNMAGLAPDVEPTFEQFVRSISTLEPNRLEKHWAIQHFQSCSAFVQMDFVGKLESVEADFAHVAERIGCDAQLLNHAVHATRATEEMDSAYDLACADMVYERYKADFDNFGYDRRTGG